MLCDCMQTTAADYDVGGGERVVNGGGGGRGEMRLDFNKMGLKSTMCQHFGHFL